MTAGSFSDAGWHELDIDGYSNAAVTAGQFFVEKVVTSVGRIGGIQANAATAGTGVGNTVLDVLLNGTSIWTVSGDRPTLAAASTGAFASKPPATRLAIKPGDILALKVASISTTGHARLSLSVALEKPRITQ